MIVLVVLLLSARQEVGVHSHIASLFHLLLHLSLLADAWSRFSEGLIEGYLTDVESKRFGFLSFWMILGFPCFLGFWGCQGFVLNLWVSVGSSYCIWGLALIYCWVLKFDCICMCLFKWLSSRKCKLWICQKVVFGIRYGKIWNLNFSPFFFVMLFTSNSPLFWGRFCTDLKYFGKLISFKGIGASGYEGLSWPCRCLSLSWKMYLIFVTWSGRGCWINLWWLESWLYYCGLF